MYTNATSGDFTRLDHNFSRNSDHEKLFEGLNLLYQYKYFITKVASGQFSAKTIDFTREIL